MKKHIIRIEDGLYIGDAFSITNDDVLQSYNICSILSVCQTRPSADQSSIYTCLVIDVLDESEQNIIQYFPQCIDFITTGLKRGGVLVHCQAGQSRSATVLAAYLMHRDKVSAQEAMVHLRRFHNVHPNDGFLEQLQLFAACDFQVNDSNVLYRRFKFRSLGLSSDPKPEYGENDTASAKHTSIRCKKCRFVLASEKHIIQHEVNAASSSYTAFTTSANSASLIHAQCAHFFLEPIRWMKPELDKGHLEGRFSCPGRQCGAKIGSYKWHGMTCSCHTWVLPALCIQRGKVDEMKSTVPPRIAPARTS